MRISTLGIAVSSVPRHLVLPHGSGSSVLHQGRVASRKNAARFQVSSVTRRTSITGSARRRALMVGVTKREDLGHLNQRCRRGKCPKPLLRGSRRSAPRGEWIAARQDVVQTVDISAFRRMTLTEPARLPAGLAQICMTQMVRIGLARSWDLRLQVGQQSLGRREETSLIGSTRSVGRSSKLIAASPSVARRLATSVMRRTRIGLLVALIAFRGRGLATLVGIGVAKSWGLAHGNLGESHRFFASPFVSLRQIMRQV
jgi:hypothetical protein